MTEIFLRALDKLTEPLAIIALLLMLVVIILVRSVTRHLPELNRTLGKQATILEHLIYDIRRGDDDQQD